LAAGLLIQWSEVHASSLSLPGAPVLPYWSSPHRDDSDRDVVLRKVVDRTCERSTSGRYSLVGVDLDWFNGHALTFYSAKAALHSGARCHYQYFDLAPSDLDVIWKRFDELDAAYLIGFDPAAAPPSTDPLNKLAVPIVERARRDPALVPVPFDPSTGVVLFRRTAHAGNGQ
jgi:hypothetical protein